MNSILKRELELQLSKNKKYVELKKKLEEVRKQIEEIEKSVRINVT
jgi:hypothetical protein